jgi:hypothetical protein
VRTSFLFLASVAFAVAQSHPSWWNYSSPGATALVGIEWQSVQNTPVTEALEAELWGNLGFPDLPCLRHARTIIISSPELLALAAGNCSALKGALSGFEPMTYRGVDMFYAKEKGVLSIARLGDQLLMLGDPKTLEMAVDRELKNTKDYSALLARAAQFSGKDFWVVSSQLPDDLANRFLPLTVEAQRFEGSVSFRNGLELQLTVKTASDQRARASVEQLRQDAKALPSVFRGLEITSEDDSILISLNASREQVLASIQAPEPEAKPAETIKVETPKKVEYVPIVAAKPAEKPVENVEKPQVIRIVGLDDGPKEIVLPAIKPDPR